MRNLIITACAMMALGAQAQVTVEARIDSLELMVGEQTDIRLEVSAPAEGTVQMPELREGALITGDVEVVRASAIDTTKLNGGKTMLLGRTYTVTSFCDHDTLCKLPPFVVKVNDEEHLSKELALKIYTLDVDTLHADQFFPPKEIDAVPLTWDDVKGVVFMGIAIAALALILLFVLYRYRQGRAIVTFTFNRKKRLPPHQVALEEINRIKSERKWASEDSKEYYTLLTDALRRYMSERYGFNAMEMTSAEIIERLLQQDDVMLDELRDLFTTADLVKFAKASTLIGENDMNLVNAITYIQQTKVEVDPNAEPERPALTAEQQQHIVQRRVMVAVMIVCAVAIVVLLGLVAYRLWDLLLN